MDIVNEILEKSAKEAENYKPTDVEKHLELEFDLGSLLAFDLNALDMKKLQSNKNDYLKSLARDNTQLLFNQIWTLPTDNVDGVTVAKLPKQSTNLPRAKPVPKPRQMTKWEKFAQEKGIQKKKKDKLQWDEILKKWVPRYGYKKSQAEKEKDWVIEVPQNADPFEDQFEKKKNVKDEKIAKNEFQRLRNIAKSRNIKIPKVGLVPSSKPTSSQLDAQLTVAKFSTASLGKFQKGIPKEKMAKKVKEFLPGNRKRKAPLPTPEEEKKQSIEMIESILNKKPKLNLEQAVEKQMKQDRQEEQTQKHGKKQSKGGRSKAGAKGGKFRMPQNKAGKKGKMAAGGGGGGGKGGKVAKKRKGGKRR